MNDVYDKIYNVQVDNDQMNDDTQDYNQENNELSIKQLKQQRDYQEDILRNKVRNAYNELVSSELDLENLNLQLDSINKKYSDMKLKNQIGLATSLDMDEFQLNVQKLKDRIQASEIALKTAQYSFKNLTGIDVTKYSLNQDIKYDKFEIDGSVDEYLDQIVEDFIESSFKQEIIDNDKEHLNDIRDDVKITKDDKAPKKEDYYKTVTDSESGVSSTVFDKDGYATALSDYTKKLQEYLQYLGNKLTNLSNQTTLNEEKKAFKEALRKYYVALVQQENIIEIDIKNIELDNQKLKNTKLQYDLGLITKNKYDDKLIESLSLQSQLRKDIKTYNEYKDQIQKPWLTLTVQ